MENASKALIIAGGIFLALALITFGVYTYSSIHDFSNMQDEKTAQEQLAAFNKSFEAYNKSIMHGTDLITVMNKAIDNNKKYNNDSAMTISIAFSFKETAVYEYDSSSGKRNKSGATFFEGKEYAINDFDLIKSNSVAFDDFKRRTFKCTDVNYNGSTGRISSMKFEEIKLTDQQYEHK